MIKKFEFVEKVLATIRKDLECNLPKEATLEEMIDKFTALIKKRYNI